MQGATRMVAPNNPHMQHPGMNPPMDAASLQHMTVNGAANRMGGFDPSAMTDEARMYYEQQARLQQQQQQQQNRDGKAAAQRSLGVAAQQQQQVNGQMMQSAQMLPQGIRAMPMQGGGQIFVDAQGRQVQIPVNWQQHATDPRQPPSGAMNQAQLHTMYQQQQQQQQQQMQQQHQMLPPQQQAQQMHLQRQQQLAQQRGSQPPVVRPPAAMQPSQMPGQSPALLQVPPPPIKRVMSRGPSRSASPMPNSMRPPHQTSQPMQASASAFANTGNQPAILPPRAATLPVVPQVDMASLAEIPEAGPSRPISDPVKSASARTKFVKLPAVGPSRNTKRSAAGRAKRVFDKKAALKRTIEHAQACLEQVEKEEAEAELVNTEDKVDPQVEFNEKILEYLSAAGYHSAAGALKSDLSKSPPQAQQSPQITLHDANGADGSSLGDATLVEGTDPFESKSAAVSPKVILSPVKSASNRPGSPAKSSAPLPDTKVVSTPAASSTKGDDNDSIFGSEKAQTTPKKMVVDEQPGTVKQESSPARSPMSVNVNLTTTADKPVDLGYLYTWWTVYQDTLRLVKKKQLRQLPARPNTAVIASAIPPTSAVAAKIAVGSPAAAVRAASVDIGSQHMASASNSQDPTPLTAQLQQAEAMRQAQQAQIHAANVAQQEAMRRQMMARAPEAAQQQGNDQRQMYLINGQPVAMSQEELYNFNAQNQRALQEQMMRQQQAQQTQQTPQHLYQQLQADGQYQPMTPGDMRPGQGQIPMHMINQAGADIDGSPHPGPGPTPTNKRNAEQSPMDASNKKSKVVGKRPTPEEHQRQAIEMASRVTQGMPAPGIPHMPAVGIPQLQRNTSQTPRPMTDAERQYALNQAAYAKQQVDARSGQSPVTLTGMSPAMGSVPSPAVHNPVYEVGVNGVPQQSPAVPPPPPSARGKKGKGGPPLTVDTDSAAEFPDATPSGKRKASANKRPPKSATEKNKPKNAKQNGKSGRPSTADGLDVSPAMQTPNQMPGYNPMETPVTDTFGHTGSGSAPSSSQSQTFQLPSSDGQMVPHPPSDPMSMQNQIQLQQPQQALQSAMQPQHPQQVIPQQQQQQQQQAQIQPQLQPQPQALFDPSTMFNPEEGADFLSAFNNFNPDGLPYPVSASYEALNFDDFNFNMTGDNPDDWLNDTSLTEGS